MLTAAVCLTQFSLMLLQGHYDLPSLNLLRFIRQRFTDLGAYDNQDEIQDSGQIQRRV